MIQSPKPGHVSKRPKDVAARAVTAERARVLTELRRRTRVDGVSQMLGQPYVIWDDLTAVLED